MTTWPSMWENNIYSFRTTLSNQTVDYIVIELSIYPTNEELAIIVNIDS